MSVSSDPSNRREPASDESFSEQETERRRDDAVRRALNTPAKPHKPSGKRKPSPARKKSTKKGR